MFGRPYASLSLVFCGLTASQPIATSISARHAEQRPGHQEWVLVGSESGGGGGTQPALVRARKSDAPWHTAAGVRIGITLPELERLAGAPVTFSGFGWDYGGGASWEEEGGRMGLRLSIDPASNELLWICRIAIRAQTISLEIARFDRITQSRNSFALSWKKWCSTGDRWRTSTTAGSEPLNLCIQLPTFEVRRLAS